MSKKKEYEEKYPNKPWLDAPNIWKTEAAYWNYVRGVLRRGWKDFPLKIRFKILNTIPNFPGSGVINPQVKKVGKCAMCGKWFPQSALDVDHIQQAGSMKNYEQAAMFMHNLFTPLSNLQLLCTDGCHKIKNYAERMGLSLEDAIVEKQVIAFAKLPVNEQIEKLQAVGAEIKDISNQAKRKDYYREYLKRNKE